MLRKVVAGNFLREPDTVRSAKRSKLYQADREFQITTNRLIATLYIHTDGLHITVQPAACI